MVHENYFAIPHREGYWDLGDYELYYRAFGSGDETMLVLHGGPGFPSDVLAPLAVHGSEDRTVYIYDQFGTGRSDRPASGDFSRYTVDHFRGEVEAVREAVGADEVVLYGNSWGAMLALEYALEHPERVSRMVLTGALHDAEDALAAIRDAREEVLSDAEEAEMEELEARHAFDDPRYRELVDTFWKETGLRTEEEPLWYRKGGANPNMDLYGLMWGPTESVMLGTRLRDWSVKDELGDIDVPTLIISGEHDEMSPEIARDMAERMPDAELVVLEDASHMVMWEKPDEHREAIEAFLG